MSLIVIGAVLSGAVSCREDVLQQQTDNQMVEVSFRPVIDGVEMEVVPIDTKAGEGEKTYSLIMIEQEGGTSGNHYSAYGFFDASVNEAKIQLPSGKTYRFSMLVIRETENGHLAPYLEDPDSPSYGGFANPFSDRKFIKPANEFITDTWSISTSSPICGADTNPTGYNAFVYRYVGYTTIENLQNGGKISIPLKRYYFALNMSVTPPIDGTLEVSIPDFQLSETLSPGDATLNLFRIVNSRQVATIDAAEDFSEDHNIEIKWTRDPSVSSFDVQKTISFVKGMQLNLNVNMNDRAGFTGFDPQIEGPTTLPEATVVID